MLNVGIVGFGGMGRGRLAYYREIPQARIVAIADICADELRSDPTLQDAFETPSDRIAWYHSIEELLGNASVDLVDICLPTQAHAQAAIAALSAGIHVLCEKPMALTVDDCEDMLRARDAAGAQLMIAQCVRFWPEYEYLADLVHSADAGRLISLQMSRQGANPRAGHGWMCQQGASGGAILDLHIHDLDYCR